MTSRLSCGIALSIALLSSAASAQVPAQPDPEQWRRGTTLNLFGGLSGDSTDRAPLAGGAFGWEIAPWIELEASGEWIEWGHSAHGFSTAMRALVPLRPSRSTAPFLAAGVGLHRAWFQVADPLMPEFYRRRVDARPGAFGASATFTDPSLVFGGGVRMFLARQISIRPQVDATVVMRDSHTRVMPSAQVHLAYHFEEETTSSMRAVTASAIAQRGRDDRDRDRRPPPRPSRPPVVLRGHVFIGGYYYDPFFGPYPWWPRTRYPYRYFPMYDYRAEVHVKATPKSTAVYVDGFYAGIADDFDGIFQSLPLPPGGHDIVLYLDGYRTVRRSLYLRPGSSLTLHETMMRLPASQLSEPPTLAPPVPPPPAGSYRSPSTPPPVTRAPQPPADSGMPHATAASGTLELHVQPATATVTIDGQRWLSSDEGSFVVELPLGTHSVEISQNGYRSLKSDVVITEGAMTPLNVTLAPNAR